MDDQTVLGFLERSHQDSDTLLKQEWQGKWQWVVALTHINYIYMITYIY